MRCISAGESCCFYTYRAFLSDALRQPQPAQRNGLLRPRHSRCIGSPPAWGCSWVRKRPSGPNVPSLKSTRSIVRMPAASPLAASPPARSAPASLGALSSVPLGEEHAASVSKTANPGPMDFFSHLHFPLSAEYESNTKRDCSLLFITVMNCFHTQPH